MVIRHFARLGLAALVLLLVACSSTGSVTKTDVTVPQTVKAPVNVHPEVAPYLPEFVDALKSAGFIVGTTDNPDALELKLEFNGNPFNIRVSASLWQRGVPLLSASATNPGWGTALARGIAVNGRAESALESFRNQLAEFSTHIRIVPDVSR